MPHGQQYRALMQKELEFDILSKIESFSYLTGFCLTVIIGIITKMPHAVLDIYLQFQWDNCNIILLSEILSSDLKRSKLRD
ncbi:hypothetical protein [Klebsiella pneumoniae]|uniref:hypothetical protein n=1 Tax=Klebsiella pneumoniae TaxID=573 RepID=UPI002265B453|nr:hypothetical protein [Klebsiella pneumoniae]